MLEGVVRKISFVLVYASAVAWILFDVGFGMRNAWKYSNFNETVVDPMYFNHWFFATSAVTTFFMFFVHLLCGNRLTGALTLLFIPFYLIAAGGVLQLDGDYLYQYYKGNVLDEYVNYVPVEFAGVLASVVLMWLSLILWTFQSQKPKPRAYTNMN